MKQYILVLGGSQFMGKELLRQLSQNENYVIVYINRCKEYWNNEVKQYKNLIYYYGDRKEYKDMIKLLEYINQVMKIEENQKWIIIDFAAYNPKHIYSIYEGMKKKTHLYILISSDSIYDVCDENKLTKPIKEESGQRPVSKEERRRLRKDEDYGEGKLRCEEFLNEVGRNEFPYISLRLADVIGPQDSTHRFWCYLQWINHYQQPPLFVDSLETDDQLSFVYSLDVVRLLLSIISNISYYFKTDPNAYQSYLHKITYQAYNLAFDQTITIQQLLSTIIHHSDQPKRQIQFRPKAPAFYPSVICGPISNQKAKDILDFQTTHIFEAVQHTTIYYQQISNNIYPKEQKECLDKLLKKFQKI